MEWLPTLIDFLLRGFQLLAILFLAYGAYLTVRPTGVWPSLGEPSRRSADAEKKIALESETPQDHRLYNRRKSDRRTHRQAFMIVTGSGETKAPRWGDEHEHA